MALLLLAADGPAADNDNLDLQAAFSKGVELFTGERHSEAIPYVEEITLPFVNMS